MAEPPPHVQVAAGYRQRINTREEPTAQALIGQRVPGVGRGIVAGDVAQVGQRRRVASLGEVPPHVQVAPDHRQRTNRIAQALLGQRVPGVGRGIVAGDAAQVGNRPVAGSGENPPHVQVTARHRQLNDPIVQPLIGQRVPGVGRGIVAGDAAQVGNRPVAGLAEPPPHVQVAPGHRQRTNPNVQTLIGQGVPGVGRGIVAGDVAQVGNRPVAGLGEDPPHVQVAAGHRQRSNLTVQALIGQRVPGVGRGIGAGDVAQVGQHPVAGLGEVPPHVQVAPGHRQRINPIVQALIGQRVPGSDLESVGEGGRFQHRPPLAIQGHLPPAQVQRPLEAGGQVQCAVGVEQPFRRYRSARSCPQGPGRAAWSCLQGPGRRGGCSQRHGQQGGDEEEAQGPGEGAGYRDKSTSDRRTSVQHGISPLVVLCLS